jgi:hypothetical protein
LFPCRFASLIFRETTIIPQVLLCVSLLPKATGEGSNFPHSLPFHVITMIPITFIRRISYWEKDNLNLKHNGNPQKKKSKLKKKKKKKSFSLFSFLRMWLCEFKQEGENHGRISNDDKLMHTLYVSLERENLMATATTPKKNDVQQQQQKRENPSHHNPRRF